MKILITTAELGYRGTPRVVAEYARMLSSRHQVAVWGWRDAGGETVGVLRGEGFVVFDGPVDSDLAYAFKPDVLNIHRPGLPYEDETRIIRRFKAQGAKCIETNVFGRVDPTVAGLIDLSIQISRWNLFQWSRWKGGLPIRAVYCPNPVNVDKFTRTGQGEIVAERMRFGLSADEAAHAFVLGRIGNTSWLKLADPVRVLLNRHDNFHVVHVRDHSQTLPADLLNHPRVHCVDRLVGEKQLSSFYSACSACVSMSPIGESFGLANAEALSCGTPVIAVSTPFHCNAQVEVVGLGGATVVAKVDDVVNVVSKMVDGESERCIPNALRRSIADRYSPSHVREMLLVIFDSVMAGDSLADAFVTSVTRKEVTELLRRVKGGSFGLKRLLMNLYYTPFAYRLVRALKSVRRK